MHHSSPSPARLGLLVLTMTFAALCSLALPSLGQQLPAAPPDRVLDRVGVLSGDQRQRLVESIDQLELDTGAEIGVLVAASSEGEPSSAYALRVFNHWGVGKEATDNGLLLVLLTEDRRVEITPGDGYRDLFTQRRCEALLRRYVVPQLKAGQPGEAVLAAVGELADAVRMHEQGLAPSSLESSAPVNAAPPIRRDPIRTETAPTPRRSSSGVSAFGVVGGVACVGGVIGLIVLCWPKCPRCETRLRVRSRTIDSPTYSSTGRGEKTYSCGKCAYSRRKSYTIPRLTLTTQSTSFGGSSGGSSFGGSSGGSSFGGGSSSGGGGGSSW